MLVRQLDSEDPMNKTPFLILLVFLLAVAGAIFAWTSNDPVDITPDETELWLEDDPEAANLIDPNPLRSSDAQPEEAEGELLEGLEEISREEITSADGDASHLVVQVWNGEKGVPAAAADVFFLDGFEGPELKDPFAQHWSDLAETRGRRFKTDVAGRVSLPPVERWAIVTAQRPGAYGFAKVGRKHREVETILLQPDETVTVLVIDGEDRPVAEVPVGVVQRVPVREQPKFQELMAQMKMLEQQAARVERYIKENPGQREAAAPRMRGIRERQRRVKGALGRLKGRDKGRDKRKKGQRPVDRGNRVKPTVTARPELRAQRRTNDDGIAVFRHFQVYRHQHEKWWPPPHIDQFEAVLLMPLQRPESRAFSGRPVPEETIELRLPPIGSIALRTVDLDGRPFTHPVQADLRMQGENLVPWARVRQRKEQNETEIVFPFVGLGLQFTAHCRLDDDDFRWSIPLFAGPNNAGERVIVDVVVAPSAGMLFGRLLDRAGEPLAGVRPTFLINSGRGRLEGEDITLDNDSRFHLPYLVRDQHRAPFRLEIRHDRVRPVAGLAMTLPRLPAGRVTDLGDLRIDALGKIAYGTVVDDRGQPVPGATVQLQRERDAGGKQPQLVFVDEAFVVARADTEGRYELFGELEPGRHRLRAQARNHFPFESRDLRQDKQVDPQLLRNSKVVGTVLTPPWMSSRNLRVVLESAVNTRQRREDRVHDYKGKKYIYFDWVRPGIHNVLIRLQDFPDPILRVDGLQLLAGQQGVHRRLTDLNLGAFLYRFEVAAVDGRGQPIQPDWPLLARIVRPSGQTGFVGFPWRGKRLEVVSASPELLVWPLANGYRAERTMLGPGASQLRFLKIPPVELHLPGLRRLVGEALVWIAMRSVGPVSPAGGMPNKLESWDRRSGRISGWFTKLQRGKSGKLLGQGDTLQIPLMLDGRYKVIAYLIGTTRSRKVRPVPLELGAVDVRLVPGAGPQRVTVNVDPKKVQQGLAEVAQREAASGGQKRQP
jgi:hypothetical protein